MKILDGLHDFVKGVRMSPSSGQRLDAFGNLVDKDGKILRTHHPNMEGYYGTHHDSMRGSFHW